MWRIFTSTIDNINLLLWLVRLLQLELFLLSPIYVTHSFVIPKSQLVSSFIVRRPVILLDNAVPDEGDSDHKRQSSENDETSGIISYNDFDDFEFTTGTLSPLQSLSSSSDSSDSDTTTNVTALTFYNDFDDGKDPIHPPSPPTLSSSRPNAVLSSRMMALEREEQRRIAVCDRNWKLGNWFVRGFSLEMTTSTTTATDIDMDTTNHQTLPVPSVSSIVTSSSSSSCTDDMSDVDDTDAFSSPIDVWVGRTDGSVYGIQLGTDYWTRFGSAATADGTPTGNLDVMDEKENRYSNNPINMMVVNQEEEDDDDDDNETTQLPTTPTSINPFTIVTQFQCTSSASEVTSIVAIPVYNDDHDNEWVEFDIYVACMETIEHWYYDGHDTKCIKTLPYTQSTTGSKALCSIRSLKQIHTMVNNVPTTLILSVTDHRLTLWNTQTDVIVGNIDTVQIPDSSNGSSQNDNVQTITCIDANNEFIYIGTESGYVLVYAVSDIILQQQSESIPTSAVGYWRATPTDACSVTAIKCGGPGTLGRNSVGATSTVLYTGDAQGLVKQWEVLKMVTKAASSTNDDNDDGIECITNSKRKNYKVEAWPKLSSQRLPKRAHMFTGHYSAITGLLAIDALKFVSASADGTVRAWNTASGKELFRMDGFPDPIRNLCLLDSGSTDNDATDRLRNTILVTDGMDKYVCVHDFSADDEDTADYDLDMPEYIR